MTQLDGKSMDIVSENIAKLKELFPEIFDEGKIDFVKLQEELGSFVDTQSERYNFTWNGKSEAKQIAQTPSTGTLRPCVAESKNWDTTQNLYIEGDNLEVLKLLQKSYHKQVKMIYIDPPYNTGKDFVYKDNFHDNIKNYLEITGQVDSEGNRLSANSDTNGRYHSDWLNMMYPRIKLARNLLRDDGVIFISIDDNEVHNLRKLCDEIFGEDNFIAEIIWRKKYGIQNDAKYFSNSHEYIIGIAKNKNAFVPNLLERSEEQNNRYKNPDNDSRGIWKPADFSVGRVTEKDIYPITTPSGRDVMPPEGRSWVSSEEKFFELIKDGRIWFGESGNNVPSVKKFLTEVKQGITPSTFWDYSEVGHTDGSNKALKSLFDNKQYFDYPKPVELLKRLIQIGMSNGEIVLDFFSGSATTSHAVMQLNSEDSGNRKYICIQIPEMTDEDSEACKAGYKNICEIGKERIRRAGEKIKAEMAKDLTKNQDLDIGFKVLKLDSSNIKTWDSDFENLEANLLDAVDNVKSDRTVEDLLYEVLLKYGLNLTLPIEEKSINDSKIYVIGFGALIVCLDDHVTLDTVKHIAKLKEEYAAEKTRVVFKDSSFSDAVVKTNALQTLKQFGIDEVVSI